VRGRHPENFLDMQFRETKLLMEFYVPTTSSPNEVQTVLESCSVVADNQ
jgi:hypothetical protein